MAILYLRFNSRDEKLKFILSCIHSIASGVCQCMLATIPIAIFLQNFSSAILPFIYIATSLLALIIGFLFYYLEQKLPFYAFILCVLAIMGLPLFFLNILILFSSSIWVIWALTLWSQFVLWVTDLEFWGLLNRLFNLQQAKKYFGLIGTGISVSASIIGLLIPFFTQYLDVKVLLLFSSFALLFCISIVLALNRLFPNEMSLKKTAERSTDPQTKAQVPQKINTVLHSKYLQSIFFICFAINAVFYFVDIAFNTSVQDHFITEEKMANFLGVFFAFSSVLQIGARLLLFPFLLKRFSITISAMLLPALAAGIMLLTLGSSFVPFSWGLILVFWFMVLNKLWDDAIRFSIFEPTKLLFFQILLPSLRMWSQLITEIIIYPIATILTSLIIILLIRYTATPLIYYILFGCLLSILSVVTLIKIKKIYFTTLAEAIRKGYFTPKLRMVVDKSCLSFLKKSLESPHPEKVIYSLEALEKVDIFELEKVIHRPLYSDNTLIKEFSLKLIYRNKLRSFYETVLKIAQNQNEENTVRSQAMLAYAALSESRNLEPISPFLYSSNLELKASAMIAFLKFGNQINQEIALNKLQSLLNSDDIKERLKAIKILGELPELPLLSSMIEKLMLDKDTVLQKSIIELVVKTRMRDFYFQLVKMYSEKKLKKEVNKACAEIGDEIFSFIQHEYKGSTEEKKLELLKLISGIKFSKNKEEVFKFLHEQIGTSKLVDNEIWTTLFKLGFSITESQKKLLDQYELEFQEKIESLEFLITYCNDLPFIKEIGSLLAVLMGQVTAVENYIFQLLFIYYPKDIIKKVTIGLKSNSEEQQGYAFELLQTIIKGRHTKFIILINLIVEIKIKTQLESSQHIDTETINLIKTLAINEKKRFSPITQATALYMLYKYDRSISPKFFESISSENTSFLISETCHFAARQTGDLG